MSWPFLDAKERALVAEALPLAGERQKLEAQLARLGRIAELAKEAASDVPIEVLAVRIVGGGHDVDLRLPPKAALWRAYLLSKIHVLRELATQLKDSPGADDALRRRADTELAQSIHTHLAEELFVEVAADAEVAAPIRRGAVRKLSALWRDPLQIEIDDVAPLLDAIWEARCRLRPVLGTLLGTHETFALFQSAKDDRFLDHFTRDDVSEDELEAFHEFLFGLSVEQCDILHEQMRLRGVAAISLSDARGLLGLEDDAAALGSGPDAMVVSYRDRKIRASYRVLAGVPGPRRTAEEHVVIARLARGENL